MTTKTTGQRTPGPWKYKKGFIDQWHIGNMNKFPIFTIVCGTVEAKANAKLIAAAPDMLLALGAIMDQAEIGNLSRKHPSVDSAIRRVLAAITIATKED